MATVVRIIDDGEGPDPDVLTPGQVGAMFNVDSNTVARWGKEGKLSYFRTLGGHRRFYLAEVQALIAATARAAAR